jgi:hypothetical protein
VRSSPTMTAELPLIVTHLPADKGASPLWARRSVIKTGN